MVTILTVGVTIYSMAMEHNKKSAEDSKTMVVGALSELAKSNENLTIDYSWWNEAYDRVISDDTAWIEYNFGASVYSPANTLDLFVSVQPATANHAVKYAWAAGFGEQLVPDVIDPQTIRRFSDRLSSVDSNDRLVVSEYIRINDSIYIVAAAHVIPDDFQGLEQSELFINIMGVQLSDKRLLDMGNHFLIDDLSLSYAEDPSKIAHALVTDEGDIAGQIIWTPSRPGNLLLKKAVLPVSLVMIVFSVFAIWLSQRIKTLGISLIEEKNRSDDLRVEAQVANRAKSEFLANMSHEIRTPLHGVKSSTDILIKQERDEQKLQFLEIIEHSSETLIEIIDGLLDLSKIEAGKFMLKYEDFSLRQCIYDVQSLMKQLAFDNNIEYRTDIQNRLPEMVVGDRGRIRQVLINIIGNAIKFTPEGSVKTRIHSQISANAVALTIDVIDSGIGISPDHIETIFEKFRQADESMTKELPGTGLGLAISAMLVKEMGGKISVKSELGIGSVFRIELSLPLAHTTLSENRYAASEAGFTPTAR
jgi:signal transduction histidine kinase